MIAKAILVVAMVLMFAAAPALAGGCPLDSAKDGQVITFRGKVVHAPHDMTLEIAGCTDSVVLVYADDGSAAPGNGVPGGDIAKFRAYTNATTKRVGGAACLQCPKYEVEATLSGRLALAVVPAGLTKDGLGFLRDSSGKIVGKVGFGHPIPLYKYQLAIQAASDIEARRLK
jgi:hypothetical protein